MAKPDRRSEKPRHQHLGVAEERIARAVAEEKARLWKIESREAIQSLNVPIEEDRWPLDMLFQGF